MRDTRTKLKNAAIFPQHNGVRPKLDNDIRWSGKYELLESFFGHRKSLIEENAHTDSDIEINKSVSIANKTERYARRLKKIMVVTEPLQIDGRALADCS